MQVKLSPSDNFDLALSLNREPGTEFVLQKGGQYFTLGNWYYKNYKHLAPKCKLYGEGARLSLSPDAVRSVSAIPRPDRDLNVLWTDEESLVSNLTIDGNEKAFQNVDPVKKWYITTGIRGFGKQYYSNVIVENIRGDFNPVGTLSSQIESFAFSTVGGEGGSVIKDCKVQNCPENSYISSFNIGHVGNVLQSIVSNCSIDIGKNNWLAFGVNCKVLVKNCSAKGNRIALYNDTLITDSVIVDKCSFEGIDKLISFVIPPGSNDPKKDIAIKNSQISYSEGSVKHLVELWDQNNDKIERQLGPILLESNKITANADAMHIAAVGNDIRSVILLNTLVSNLKSNISKQLCIF